MSFSSASALISQTMTGHNKPGSLNLSPAGRVQEAEYGSEGREKGRLYVFYGGGVSSGKNISPIMEWA